MQTSAHEDSVFLNFISYIMLAKLSKTPIVFSNRHQSYFSYLPAGCTVIAATHTGRGHKVHCHTWYRYRSVMRYHLITDDYQQDGVFCTSFITLPLLQLHSAPANRFSASNAKLPLIFVIRVLFDRMQIHYSVHYSNRL